MTRGTAYALFTDGVFSSIEFNGDMYPDGNGDMFMEILSDVTCKEEFESAMSFFNDTVFRYEEDNFTFEEENLLSKDNIIDMRKEKYGLFFSDWIFIKNNMGEDIMVVTKESKEVIIPDGEYARFNFRTYVSEEKIRKIQSLEKVLSSLKSEREVLEELFYERDIHLTGITSIINEELRRLDDEVDTSTIVVKNKKNEDQYLEGRL